MSDQLSTKEFFVEQRMISHHVLTVMKTLSGNCGAQSEVVVRFWPTTRWLPVDHVINLQTSAAIQFVFKTSIVYLSRETKMLAQGIKYASASAAVFVGLYAVPLGSLTLSSFQAHVVYLHKIQMTWFKDLNVSESFGFLRNQVTPFEIKSIDGGMLYAWHILPIELYREQETSLIKEPSGFTSDGGGSVDSCLSELLLC